ncbi:odorant receptor Or1 isoform X2 [Galleria mellonella]|uniref:Odorant receptor n=1 Tax=Galleria mellonella TaxID=7137 RepID=A0ABM3MFQ7_GALME|nr:odorant receptor Or1 isoform X2 [Galleria mellonella]
MIWLFHKYPIGCHSWQQILTMSLAGSCVALHLRFLRCCGYCRLAGGDGYPPLLRWLHHAYRYFALALMTAYLLQQCVYAYQEQTDMDKLARVMFLLLCHVTSITKQIVFHVDAERIDEMITGLDDRLYNEVSEKQAQLLSTTCVRAARLVRVYTGTAFITCTLWIVFPILEYANGRPVDFPFWAGIDYNHSRIRFLLVLLYSYYATSLEGIANTTMDAFIATILYQCQTQLKILRMNIEILPDRARAIVKKEPNQKYEAVLWKLFIECLTHYKKITSTSKILQDIFGTVILIQFAIGGWTLCMAAYKLVSLNVLSIEFASITLFIMCIFIELLLFCYYGNEVKVEKWSGVLTCGGGVRAAERPHGGVAVRDAVAGHAAALPALAARVHGARQAAAAPRRRPHHTALA